jgi:AcrR family transcriptional regulator
MTEDRNSEKMDRRIQHTYEQLTDALPRLLLQKDWSQITVQELCDEAVIRRTTFYQHFHDKHEFMRWRMQERLKEFSAYIDDVEPPQDPVEHFLLLSTRVLDYMNQHPQFEKVAMETGDRGLRMVESFLRRCTDKVVARLNERGDVRWEDGTCIIPIVSEFWVGGLLAVMRWWYANGKPCTEEELINYLRRIVERNREQ